MGIYCNNEKVCECVLLDGFFVVNAIINDNSANSCFIIDTNDENIWQLGLLGQEKMSKLAKCGLLGSLSNVNIPMCK